MSEAWQVQEAKNRFSELIDRALTEGPQVITRHGKPVARVVAADVEIASREDDGFLQFLLSIPKTGSSEGLPAMPRRNRRKSIFDEG